MDLNSFGKRMKVLGDEVVENSHALTKRVAKSALGHVVIETPVLTGKARSNWQVGIGSAPSKEIDTFGPDAAKVAIDQGSAIIDNYRGNETIHITNNASHIGALNEGSSRQAPANFVEIAVLKAVEVIGDTRILVTKSTSE